MRTIIFWTALSLVLMAGILPAQTAPQRPHEGDPAYRDIWLGKDKWVHFGTSFLLTTSLYYGYRKVARISENDALVLAPSWTLVMGFMKEDYDLKYKKTYVSGKDLVVDALGIALGMGVILLVKQTN